MTPFLTELVRREDRLHENCVPLFSSFSAAASAAAACAASVLLALHAKIVRDVCDIFAATSCPPAQSALSSLPPPHSSFRQRYRVTNLKMTTDVNLQEDQLCLCILSWIKALQYLSLPPSEPAAE